MPGPNDHDELAQLLESALERADALGEMLAALHIAHALEVLRMPPWDRKCDPDLLQ